MTVSRGIGRQHLQRLAKTQAETKLAAKQNSFSTKSEKMVETGKDGLPLISFASTMRWELWLQENHVASRGLWVKIAKKASKIQSVTYPEVLDGALCFGWIDGIRTRFDETWFLQRVTPRRAKSKWSQVNREKVKVLTKQGRMRPAGQAAVDAAKADGRWDQAYPPQSKLTAHAIQASLDASSEDCRFDRDSTKSKRLCDD